MRFRYHCLRFQNGSQINTSKLFVIFIYLLERSHKKVTIQRLKNLIRKLSPVNTNTEDEFVEFLESTENSGGVIEWLDDEDGSMKSLFITSSKMKSAFRSSNPTLKRHDTS